MVRLLHIFQLGLKELVSLWRDPVLLFLIAYSFTFSVYTPSKSAVMDVVNASVAIVNEDNSEAARAVRHGQVQVVRLRLLLRRLLRKVAIPWTWRLGCSFRRKWTLPSMTCCRSL